MREFGKLTMSSSDTNITCRCDAISFVRQSMHNHVVVASFAGPASSVKAIAAALGSGRKKIELRTRACTNIGGYTILRPEDKEHGYRFYRTQLGRNAYHCLAVSRRHGLLPTIDDATLWRTLKSEDITTPLMRHWVPYIKEQLIEHRLLTRLTSFGCSPAILSATTENLDVIVSVGISSGHLHLQESEFSNAG